MKSRGDAVGNCLSVAFAERHVEWKIDARPGHHLPFERVAVNIDNPGQDPKAAGIDALLRLLLIADARNDAAFGTEMNGCGFKSAVNESLSALDADLHDFLSCRQAVSDFGHLHDVAMTVRQHHGQYRGVQCGA